MTASRFQKKPYTTLAWLTIGLLGVINNPISGWASEMTPAEAKFAERLTGAALVGTFQIDGKEGSSQERYEISKLEKLEGNDWVITSRIKFGKHDVELPVAVKIDWAGDTPVLSLTDVTLPGLGTFSTRLLFSGDRYAGTWQHDAVGGTMIGKIVPAAKKP